jgi:hypothetical protein
MYITCLPSYGRDYKSKKAVQADYDAGKDFTIVSLDRDNGSQINKQDAERIEGGVTLNIRYKRKESVHVITVKPKK